MMNFAESSARRAEAGELELETRDEKLSEYQRKLEEMESTLERTAFEKSPKFRDKFQAPYEAAIGEAAGVLPRPMPRMVPLPKKPCRFKAGSALSSLTST
jgi:hypothetical protein